MVRVPIASHSDAVWLQTIDVLIKSTIVICHNIPRYTRRFKHLVRQGLHLSWRNARPVYRFSGHASLGTPSVEHSSCHIVLRLGKYQGRCRIPVVSEYINFGGSSLDTHTPLRRRPIFVPRP